MQYYTQGQLSELCLITDGHLNSCIRLGYIPGPNVQFAGKLRKVYDQGTADRVIEYFRVKREERLARSKKKRDENK